MKPDGIWTSLFRFGTQKASLTDVLQNIPLFENLTSKELKTLERLVHIRTYEPDEAVFLESEAGAGMYVIRYGRVDILLNHKADSPVVLAELEAGDFFGEMALLGDTTRSATALAREKSKAS